VNPSTATPECPDRTITKVGRFIEFDKEGGNGHDGFMMLNLCPVRKTDPKDLPLFLDPRHAAQNQKEISRAFGKMKQPIIWAAWGNLIDSRSYLLDCLEKIVEIVKPLDPNWKIRGDLTIQKNPRHPGRLSYAHKMELFNVQDYLCRKRHL